MKNILDENIKILKWQILRLAEQGPKKCGKGIKSWRSMLPQVWKYKIFKIWNTNVSMHPATVGQPNISLSTICCKNIFLPTPSIFYQKFYWTFEPIQRSRLFSKYECQWVHVLLQKRNRAGWLISFILTIQYQFEDVDSKRMINNQHISKEMRQQENMK